MDDTFLEPLHNYLLHLLTSRTPPVLQKNTRCAEYSSGDRWGPTLMGTPRHCTNNAFRAVRQWRRAGSDPHGHTAALQKPRVARSMAVAAGRIRPSINYGQPAALQKPRVPCSTVAAAGGVRPLCGHPAGLQDPYVLRSTAVAAGRVRL